MSIVVDRTKPRHYEQDGRRYYSVSSVLALVYGNTHWADQAAMDRGTTVHRLFALSVAAYAGLCAPPDVPPELEGYRKSWHSWLDIAKPEPISIEQRAISTLTGLPFAGTWDLLCWMHDKGRRVKILIDLKSGQPEPWHRLQVQAYGKLCHTADRLALLYLDRDGGMPTWVIVKPDPRGWAAFHNALALLIYREGLQNVRATKERR